MKTPHVKTEMSLHILSYNLKRVVLIIVCLDYSMQCGPMPKKGAFYSSMLVLPLSYCL